MSWYKTLRQLKRISKHIKKNKELEDYFNNWFQENYNCKDEKEVLTKMQTTPSLIQEMVDHYETIKDRYK